MKNNNDIIENIKDCALSLFDNAEKIAGNLPTYAKDLSLTCYPSEEDGAIYINVSYDFMPEKYIERISNTGSREARDA